MTKIFNNTTEKVVEDLKAEIRSNDCLALASACFSLYAFQSLKKQLLDIKEVRFLFTERLFTTSENASSEHLSFLPRNEAERGIYGTEFEKHLRNNLTQKAISRECAEWVKSKVQFRANVADSSLKPYMTINGRCAYTSFNEFTTVELGENSSTSVMNFVIKQDADATKQLLNSFNSIWENPGKVKDVTAQVLASLEAAFRENSPELIYYIVLFNLFQNFLKETCVENLPQEAVGFKESKIWKMLYDFQKDAVLSIIHKLEVYNGCILADSVGLGKTFTALGVIKYYEKRNAKVLVLCPKKLGSNWNTYRANYRNNPLVDDRLGYTVLFHTDLSRREGVSNGENLAILNWENYDLIVIDESHNFRNGAHETTDDDGNVKLNRYNILLEKVIRKGVKTKVLMLSATPVNNRFTDLRNQLMLAFEGDSSTLDAKLLNASGMTEVLRQAQKSFAEWSRLPSDERTMESLLKSLSVDFFTILDAVTIARSRKHIRDYYDANAIGGFPTRLKPKKFSPALTDLANAPSYENIYTILEMLNLMVYVPSAFILPSRLAKYIPQNELEETLEEIKNGHSKGLTQLGREQGIRKLMGIGLLKRLESSVSAFASTLQKVKEYMESVIATINDFEHSKGISGGKALAEDSDIGFDDVQDEEEASVGRKVRIELRDMDWMSYRERIREDMVYIRELQSMVSGIAFEHDTKIACLKTLICDKLSSPINQGNKKVLVFSAFTDTARYLYDNLKQQLLDECGLHSALVTGESGGSVSTLKECASDFNEILTCFSPKSKDAELLFKDRKFPGEIDILFASDCISEGQNLQDCDMVINYDIHWNPCRIIQRFGRIDRIGSQNKFIQLVNFWPDVSLDRYIRLREKVESRMKILNISGTGDENPIANDPELDFRKRQLERLKEEAVDLEEMSDGISIMDLGLTEFQQDLIARMKTPGGPLLKRMPPALSAVAEATEALPPGTIFVLKKVKDTRKTDEANRLHPFYLVYVDDNGNIPEKLRDPKDVLEALRLLCKGKGTVDEALVASFNRETKDGREMKAIRKLLSKAIASLVEQQGENAAESFFGENQTTSILENDINGLDDFEVIAFLNVRRKKE